jgi:hypothetical protein
MFRTEFVRKSKGIFYVQTLFFTKLRFWWNNVEKYCTVAQANDNDTIWRMRFACWIKKTTNTNSEYVTLIAFSREKWLRWGASVLRLNVCCLSFLTFFSLLHVSNASLIKTKYVHLQATNISKVVAEEYSSKFCVVLCLGCLTMSSGE